jgi:hypothetical protein
MQLAERAGERREEFGLPALAVAVIRSDVIDTPSPADAGSTRTIPQRAETASTSARIRRR